MQRQGPRMGLWSRGRISQELGWRILETERQTDPQDLEQQNSTSHIIWHSIYF